MSVGGCFKDWLRRRTLRPLTKGAESMILPLGKIRAVAALLDAGEATCGESEAALRGYFKGLGIKVTPLFLDLRKDGEATTEEACTIRRTDLDWLGKPRDEKLQALADARPDLFLSLIDEGSFTVAYVAARSWAKFKVGRRQLPGMAFDIVAEDPAGRPLSQAEAFSAMTELLGKVR